MRTSVAAISRNSPGAVQVVGLDAADGLEELVRDLVDRDVEDVDVLRADQVQQQVQRSLESIDLDEEEALARRGVLGEAQIHRRMKASAAPMSQVTGVRRTSKAPGRKKKSAITIRRP